MEAKQIREFIAACRDAAPAHLESVSADGPNGSLVVVAFTPERRADILAALASVRSIGTDPEKVALRLRVRELESLVACLLAFVEEDTAAANDDAVCS